MSTGNGATWPGRRALLRVSMERRHHDEAADGLVEALERLCRRVADHLGMAGAAVNLMSTSGSEGVVAASDTRCKDLVEMQFTTRPGTWPRRVRAATACARPDLASQVEQRWQGYASVALSAGVRSAFAFPLQFGDTRLGVLDMFGEGPGAGHADGPAGRRAGRGPGADARPRVRTGRTLIDLAHEIIGGRKLRCREI